MDLYMKNTYMALATVAQLVECPLTKGKVASSISRRAQAWVCLLYTSDAADDIGQV